MSAKFASLVAIFGLTFAAASALAADRLTVHEWGTFTALQDEQGRALGGINVDDEQLPPFVHNLNHYVIGQSLSNGYYQMKGAPPRHPYVTLRLETPVVYFHLPKGAAPLKIDVDVALRGGWLTQFYPNADADAPGLKEGVFEFGPITPQTIGRLTWRGLTVGNEALGGPITDQHVWATPRNVQAARVSIAGKEKETESEKYLFYRGVGKFSAPLEVATNTAADQIEIRQRFEEVLGPAEHLTVGPLWLVNVQADGQFAYRTLAPLTVGGERSAAIGRARVSFSPNDFAFGNLDKLRVELQQALVRDGLFADEATALIETWNQAYFRAPGLRLFFLVPRRWTDHYLPLSISTPADLQRVMIGRIELVSPRQRAALEKLSQMAASSAAWIGQIKPSPNRDRFLAGRSDFGTLGVAIPPDYQAYLDLGRFRNALILDQNRRHPSQSLGLFIGTYNLDAFQVPGDDKDKP